MSNPFISCICLTYARTRSLQEAIACFLAQDYKGEHELIILNSLPAQTLILEHPNIRIINLPSRPPSLSDCRNAAIEAARGTHLVTWDSDDLFSSSYLSTVAKHFGDDDWIRLGSEYYSEGGKIKKVTQGSVNGVCYTKKAHGIVGGFKSGLSVGEDREFWTRLSVQTKGRAVKLPDNEIGYIRGWGNGEYHISGLGDDKPRHPLAYERSRFDAEHKIKRGAERTGVIQLKPAIAKTADERIAEFRKRAPENRPPTTEAVCLIELGRFGDIINILPVARLIAERWGKPAFMVNREFASVLDGVSYVIPHIFEPEFGRVKQAIDLANKTYSVVINAQVWGVDFNTERKCPAYNLESWRIAGFEKEFHNPTLLPEFDKRDLEQEAAIFKRLTNGKPLLLLKAHGALSAPFKSGARLEVLMRARFEPEYQVVELGSVKTPHIYDLLGLYDRAVLLVTIDTMTLHLAAASGVPVVALVNHDAWVSSLPRCHCVAKINYKVAEPNPEVVVQAVEEALKTATHRPMPSVAPISPPIRKLLHSVERHEEPRSPRKERAWKSWDTLYQNGVIPCHYWNYKRDATNIGDPRKLPYLKDVLQFAMDQAQNEDIVVLTNDDLLLHPGIIQVLLWHVSIFSACSSRRLDLKRPIENLNETPKILLPLGKHHVGRDLFAFKKSWLIQYWDQIGDFILGASDWDLALTCLIRLHHGMISDRRSMDLNQHPAEMPVGYVLHEIHNPFWLRPDNVNAAPSQIHNRMLFKAWATQYLPSLVFHKGNII